jgi:cysteine dioxygenase
MHESQEHQQETDRFEQMVQALRDIMGPYSGIDSEDINANDLQALMSSYTSNEDEWKRYAFGVPSVPYTRNLVDRGNGKCNLVSILVQRSVYITDCSELILVWSPGKGSPVHE